MFGIGFLVWLVLVSLVFVFGVLFCGYSSSTYAVGPPAPMPFMSAAEICKKAGVAITI